MADQFKDANWLIFDAQIYRSLETNIGEDKFDAEVERLKRCSECPNCSKPAALVDFHKLFCSDPCRDIGNLVRYARTALNSDQLGRDKLEGIADRLPPIYGGTGYPAQARRLSSNERQEILDRDNSTCQVCGEPATEIDHINGSSNDPSNLQALCKACNLAKRALKTVSRIDNPDEWKIVQAIHEELAMRIGATTPLRACDDEARWGKSSAAIRGKRRIVQHVITELNDSGMKDAADELVATFRGCSTGD